MEPAIIVAIIALVGAILTAAFSAYVQHHASTLASRREAQAVLAKFSEPLVTAAYELQGRFYNILELGFLRKYYLAGDEAQKTYAVENTLYVIAQYFGWSEILRREIQFLGFSDAKQARAVARCQHKIVELFQSDNPDLGRPLLIWRGEQRALGERMMEREGGQAQCLGYASFLDRQEPSFRRWLARIETNIGEIALQPNPRLGELQHALVDLIRELDPQHLRYPDAVLRKVGGKPPGGPVHG